MTLRWPGKSHAARIAVASYKCRNCQPTRTLGPEMSWDEFREEYRTDKLATLNENSVIDAESRLDIAKRIMKPKKLGDLASTASLHRLQARLLEGAESKEKRPRSRHTVKTYMAAVLAALNWAHFQEWLT